MILSAVAFAKFAVVPGSPAVAVSGGADPRRFKLAR
jgi:hypothetical protein